MIGVYNTSEQLRTELINAGINTVTFGRITEVDLEKRNLYPLAHITPLPITLRSSNAVVSYNVQVLDVIDINKLDEDEVGDNFKNEDNLEDILHTLARQCNTVFQRMSRNTDLYYLNTDSIELEPILFQHENMLAGYTFTFEFLVPNNDESSC